ncbi:hypothetical protein Pmani_016043 [Petrolisthes manimaculis]|uniref:Uncharacterized protein n=1 Tax=Petrolisthes manimaculis TaxID=1843537 RepID=A0AAE1U990_9EUCA|nr:hypothetical protein Pmani_016043 [Petrolisthes manimaculis]
MATSPLKLQHNSNTPTPTTTTLYLKYSSVCWKISDPTTNPPTLLQPTPALPTHPSAAHYQLHPPTHPPFCSPLSAPPTHLSAAHYQPYQHTHPSAKPTSIDLHPLTPLQPTTTNPALYPIFLQLPQALQPTS